MKSLHFKSYFEQYFNYNYDKLKFYQSERVHEMVAKSYNCSMGDVECIFLHQKILPQIQTDLEFQDEEEQNYEFYESQLYGFYRVHQSDFYIPFFAYLNDKYVLPRIELVFNYQINNSVFDCFHLPLKKEKTPEFYKSILANLSPMVKKAIQTSGIMVLDEPLRKSSIHIDLYLSQIDLANKGTQFKETLSFCFGASYEDMLFFHYDLRYYINNKMEHLFVRANNMGDFNKDTFLRHSFKSIDIFCNFKYTTIDELDVLVKKYRQVEKMYTI